MGMGLVALARLGVVDFVVSRGTVSVSDGDAGLPRVQTHPQAPSRSPSPYAPAHVERHAAPWARVRTLALGHVTHLWRKRP